MRLIFILIFFTSLFACDTSTNVKAYKDYSSAKQEYIQAILDNNRNGKIGALKEIVKCGSFLGFNISKYKYKLKTLNKAEFQNPLNIKSSYIKLSKINPIEIKLLKNMKVHFFNLHSRGFYYKVFDIKKAKITRTVVKKLNSRFTFKMAQNRRDRVRVVIFSKNKFLINYTTRNNILKISYDNKKITHYKTQKSKVNIKNKINKHRIIVIDAGHGGKDPGGIGQYHIKEKNIVLPLALDLRNELRKKGYKVYLTRYRDKFITLKNRTQFANKRHADLFISLHCNIAPKHPEVYGIETYFLSPARSRRAKRVASLENSAIGNLRSTTQSIVLNFLNKNKIIDSTKLALDIQKNLIYNLKKHYHHIKDSGVRPAPFWVLVGTNMPAILIETGFISNKKEAQHLRNRLYQKRYAQYIADGIDSYFRKNP